MTRREGYHSEVYIIGSNVYVEIELPSNLYALYQVDDNEEHFLISVGCNG